MLTSKLLTIFFFTSVAVVGICFIGCNLWGSPEPIEYRFDFDQPLKGQLQPGESVNINLSITRSANNDKDINFKCEGLPAGFSWDFTPNPIAGSSSATVLTIIADNNTIPGDYEFTIVMECPPGPLPPVEVTRTATSEVRVNEPDNDFVFSLDPLVITIPRGQSDDININLLRYSFTDAVNFSSTFSNLYISLGPGDTPVDTIFSVNPVIGNNSVLTLLIDQYADYIDGYTSYATATITGTSGSKVKRRSLRLYLSAPSGSGDFSISSFNSSVGVPQGRSVTTRVDIGRTGGHSEDITLSIHSTPQGVDFSYDPNPVTLNDLSSQLTLIADPDATTGEFQLSLTGDDGTNSHFDLMTLFVIEPFTLSISPSTITIPQGETDSVTVDISVIGGWSDDTHLTAEGGILGQDSTMVGASFNPNPVPPQGGLSSQLRLNVGGYVPPGTYPITVYGTVGLVIKSADVELIVE